MRNDELHQRLVNVENRVRLHSEEMGNILIALEQLQDILIPDVVEKKKKYVADLLKEMEVENARPTLGEDEGA